MDEALTKLFDLTGRVALVTGGAGLLGEQFSFTLARAGAVVVIADINGKDAEQLADRIRAEGMQALPYQVDITSQLQVERMVEKVVQTYQRLDILINNAALDPKFDGKEKENVDSGAFETFPLSLGSRH
jgi:NAD(P)-dependent dehydrogenase (short-subunit alcohol dehydrogenase family)